MADQETITYLRYGRELIAQGWTQEANARDADGNVVQPDDKRAVCWCIEGSLHGASGTVRTRAFAALRNNIERHRVYMWNDAPERTQDEVLKLFDDTIADLEAQPA